MDRPENAVYVGWRCTVEEHKRATVFVYPPAIELDQEAMSLLARDEVIVNANPLPPGEAMCCHINSTSELNVENRCHMFAEILELCDVDNEPQVCWQHFRGNKELVLFVELCDAQGPRSISFEPIQKRRAGVNAQRAGNDAITKWLRLKLPDGRAEDQLESLPVLGAARPCQ